MSSSISSATQQQFVQVQQNAPKTDPTKTNTQPNAALTAQAPTTTGGVSGVKGLPESKYHRNSDGTYGSNHTVTAPFNPAAVSTSQDANKSGGDLPSDNVGVNVSV